MIRNVRAGFMIQSDNTRTGNGWPAMAMAAGICILVASLIHIPPVWDALNFFDPPKRMAWALLAVLLAASWRLRSCRLDRPTLLLSLATMAWIILRTVLKPHPGVEIEVLCSWLLPPLLFVLAASMEQTRGLRIVSACLIAAGAVQAALMALQRFGLDPVFYGTTHDMDYEPGRMIGTIGYHNQAVDFLALSCAGLFLLGRASALRLALLAAVTVVAAMTGNRGGIIALVIATLAAGAIAPLMAKLRTGRRKRTFAVAALICVATVALIASLMPETSRRFRDIAANFDRSPAIQSRILLARIGCEMIEERPWTGWGSGEFAFQYLDRLAAILPEKKTHDDLRKLVFAREAHNDAIQFAAEFGMTGLLLLGVLVLSAARHLRRVGWQSETRPAILFAFSYIAVSACFSFPWQTGMAGPLAELLLGLMWPSAKTAGPGEKEIPGWNPPGICAHAIRPALTALALAIAGWYALDALLNCSVPRALAAGQKPRFIPDFAGRYHARAGASLASHGDIAVAERELRLAQTFYRDVALLNSIGHVLAAQNKWPEALAIYKQWAACGLDHANALHNLSIACEQTGKISEAARILEQKTALWPRLTPAEIKRLAVLQYRAGRPRDALHTIRSYKKTWHATDTITISEIENIEGAICLAMGDEPEAAKWFRAALKKNPRLESARRNLEKLPPPATTKPNQ